MKKIFRLSSLVLPASLATPLLALAQTGIDINVIKQPYSDKIIAIINTIFVPVLFAIAFIVFFWGVYKYFILGASSESDKAEGRRFAMWGIIGFVIILSVWGLVDIVINTFGLTTDSAPKPPTFDTSSGYNSSGNNNEPSYWWF